MSTTDTSANSSREAGFTLIEMLVVIAILAVALGATLLWTGKRTVSLDLKTTAQRAASLFKETRMAAIANNGEQSVSINTDERTIVSTQNNRAMEFSSRINIEATVAKDERSDQGIATIRFFPDGSSTGGTIRLSAEEKAMEVRVNWFTGHVKILDDN